MQLFTYDPETGHLWWLEQPEWRPSLRSKLSRVPAGHRRQDTGYVNVKVDGSYFKAHRVIWCLVTGEDPGESLIDHIDRDPSNNRIANLRLTDDAGNGRNQKLRRDNTTGFRGVTRHNKGFRAAIAINQRNLTIGTFPTAEEAAAAYRAAADRLHGEFAAY